MPEYEYSFKLNKCIFDLFLSISNICWVQEFCNNFISPHFFPPILLSFRGIWQHLKMGTHACVYLLIFLGRLQRLFLERCGLSKGWRSKSAFVVELEISSVWFENSGVRLLTDWGKFFRMFLSFAFNLMNQEEEINF